jgi:hypothetical protein
MPASRFFQSQETNQRISRRDAFARIGALGGAFLAWNFLGNAFAQSTSTPAAIPGHSFACVSSQSF